MRKEKLNYFDEFTKITDYVDKSTNLFVGLINNYSMKKLEDVNIKIHEYENDSDNVVHEVRKFLVKDFLPPIDREDIGLLLHRLDNIEDCIDEISKNFQILNITAIRKEGISKYLKLLTDASNLLGELFNNLHDFKEKDKIIEETINISKIEEEADRCFEHCTSDLYMNETNPIEIIKWTRIYNGFENLFDTYENIADTIEDIIIKNS